MLLVRADSFSYVYQTFLEYCLRMIRLKVTFDCSQGLIAQCAIIIFWSMLCIFHMDCLDSYVQGDDWLLKKEKLKIKRKREQTWMPGAEKILRWQLKEKADATKSELDNYPIEFRLDLVMRLKTKVPPVVKAVIKYLCILNVLF